MEYAQQGKLVDLSAAFGDALKWDFDQSLLDDASYNGKVIGVYQGFSNFMLWYNPQDYSGPKDPSDWQQIVDWTKSQGAKGNTVWSRPRTPAPAADPRRSVHREHLPQEVRTDLYKQWEEGTLSWTSPQVKDAWQEFGALIGNDKYVDGGVSGILATPIATGYNGLTAAKPTCQAILWGSWVPGLIGDTAQAG